jgi:hypothetical protein
VLCLPDSNGASLQLSQRDCYRRDHAASLVANPPDAPLLDSDARRLGGAEEPEQPVDAAWGSDRTSIHGDYRRRSYWLILNREADG